MEQKTNTRGGARPGSGRKMGKEQKVTISFRVTATTRDRIQKLREDGVDVNKHLEMMVALLASPKTHREFVCGGPRTGKSFQAMIEAAMGEGRKSNPQRSGTIDRTVWISQETAGDQESTEISNKQPSDTD